MFLRANSLLYEAKILVLFIHSFISDIYIAPLQDFYSEALPTTARTLNRSFTPKRMSNCELRTCPGSLRGGLRWIRTRNPPAARHQIYPLRWIRTRNPPAARHRIYLYTTAPHNDTDPHRDFITRHCSALLIYSWQHTALLMKILT